MLRRASVNRDACSTIGRRRADGVDQHRQRLVEPVDDRLLAPVEQRRQHPVGDDRARVGARVTGEPTEQVDRLGDRHLLGRGDDGDPGARRVVEDVEHPLRLIADEADLHQVADHPRRTDLADDVPRCLGVDDHEVVVALAHLVAELADREDLLDARRGVGDEVERLGERPDAAEERDLARTTGGTRAASPRCSSSSRTGSARPRSDRNSSEPTSNALARAPLASISHTSVRRP